MCDKNREGDGPQLSELKNALTAREGLVILRDEIDNKLVQPHLGVEFVCEHVALSSPRSLTSIMQQCKVRATLRPRLLRS